MKIISAARRRHPGIGRSDHDGIFCKIRRRAEHDPPFRDRRTRTMVWSIRSFARAKLSDVLDSDFYFGNHRCGQRNVSEPIGHGLPLGGAPPNKLSQDLRLLGVLLLVK